MHETEKRDKDNAIIIYEGCVCVPRDRKNISQKTNKNLEFVTGVQNSFSKVNRFPIYLP